MAIRFWQRHHLTSHDAKRSAKLSVCKVLGNSCEVFGNKRQAQPMTTPHLENGWYEIRSEDSPGGMRAEWDSSTCYLKRMDVSALVVVVHCRSGCAFAVNAQS